MNTNTTPARPAPLQALPLVLVVTELDDGDEQDWLDFVSAAVPGGAGQAQDGLNWRNAPVMLSY